MSKAKVKFVVSVMLELVLLVVLGFLIQELVTRSADEVFKGTAIFGMAAISMIFGLFAGFMIKRMFLHEEMEISSIVIRSKHE